MRPVRWRLRGDRHDAVADAADQEAREREVPEVVRAELQLEPVGGLRARDGHHARVVDQHVDVAFELGGERAHRRQVGEVEPAHGEVPVEFTDRVLALGGVAAGDDDTGAGCGQGARGLQPDAAVGAGDDERRARPGAGMSAVVHFMAPIIPAADMAR